MRHVLLLGILIFVLLVLASFTAATEGLARAPADIGGDLGRAAEPCAACHGEDAGFPRSERDALAAHSLIAEAMLQGRGALGVAGPPSPHLSPEGEPSCASCHGPEGAVEREAGASVFCTERGCHRGVDEAALKALVDQRQEEIGDLLAELRAALDAVADKDSEAYRVALTNLTFVQADGSLGLHNYAYAKAILESSLRLIRVAPEAMVSSPRSEPGREVSPIASWLVAGMLALVPGSVAVLWRRRWLQ